MYKLTCNSCNKFYIGRTKRNFKTRFNEHRRDFATSTGKSTFSEHIPNAEHETMTIQHLENDSRRINALEELEIVKATTSDRMLDVVHHINPHFRTRHWPARKTADDATRMVKALHVLPTL